MPITNEEVEFSTLEGEFSLELPKGTEILSVEYVTDTETSEVLYSCFITHMDKSEEKSTRKFLALESENEVVPDNLRYIGAVKAEKKNIKLISIYEILGCLLKTKNRH